MERISRSKEVKCFYDGHDQQLDCFDDNPDLDDVMIDDDFPEEVEMQSSKSKGHFHHNHPVRMWVSMAIMNSALC